MQVLGSPLRAGKPDLAHRQRKRQAGGSHGVRPGALPTGCGAPPLCPASRALLTPADQRGHDGDVHTQPNLWMAVSCHRPILCSPSLPLTWSPRNRDGGTERWASHRTWPFGQQHTNPEEAGPWALQSRREDSWGQPGVPPHVGHFTGVTPLTKSSP